MYKFIKNCDGISSGSYPWLSVYDLKLGATPILADHGDVFYNKLFDDTIAPCINNINDNQQARTNFVQNSPTFIVFDIPTNPLTGKQPEEKVTEYGIAAKEITVDDQKKYSIPLGSSANVRPKKVDIIFNPAKNRNLNTAIKKADSGDNKNLLWKWPTTVDLVVQNTQKSASQLFLVIKDPMITISITDCDGQNFLIDYPIGYIKEKEVNILAMEYSSCTYKQRFEIVTVIEDIILRDGLNTLGKFADAFNEILVLAEAGNLDENFSITDITCQAYSGGQGGIGNDEAICKTLNSFIDNKIKFIENNILSIAKEQQDIDLNDTTKKYTVCIKSISNNSDDTVCTCSSKMDEITGITDSINYLTGKGNLLKGAFVEFTSSKKEMKELRIFERERDLKYRDLLQD